MQLYQCIVNIEEKEREKKVNKKKLLKLNLDGLNFALFICIE